MTELKRLQIYALEKSIYKWRMISYNQEVDHGGVNCECCQQFSLYGCRNCPISDFVYNVSCINTPYQDWNGYFLENDDASVDYKKVINKETQELAIAELTFLMKVLDELKG